VDDVLFFINKNLDGQQCVVVQAHLRPKVIEESHNGPMGDHVQQLRSPLVVGRNVCRSFYYVRNCPECPTVSGGGRVMRPPLHSIPVNRLFQIVGVGIKELPKTIQGNKYVFIFQDFLTKWSMVYTRSQSKSQKTWRKRSSPSLVCKRTFYPINELTCCPILVIDICKLLGIHKLSTPAYHPPMLRDG